MDFIRYAEEAAALVNATLLQEGRPDVAALRAHLAHREWLIDQCTPRDCDRLAAFQRDLRPVFEASAEGDQVRVVAALNQLLVRHPITPQISEHDPDNLHIHVASKAASVSELLICEALLGLATLTCDLGPLRLGVCAESRTERPRCHNVFVDTSPNQSRRYCSDRCSSRANVAAYRARQRAAAVG